jgi:hypothetical protein
MGFDAVHVGLDIGKQHDPSAVVILQVITDLVLPTRYITQHLERLPIGMSYPDQAAHVVKLIGAVQVMLAQQRSARLRELEAEVQRTGQQVVLGKGGVPPVDLRLFVDVTGVGRPVYDIIHLALQADQRTRSVDERPITFAHGETYNPETGRMGKAYLVSRLQSLFQQRLIQLPPVHRHPEVEQMARELKDYEIRVTQDAKDTYGAFKVGSYDDLVTALGLGTLEDPNAGGGRIRFFD